MPRVESNIVGDKVESSAGSQTHPPSSQFCEAIPHTPKFRVLAPGLLAFGFNEVPAERKHRYTFDNLSLIIEAFLGSPKFPFRGSERPPLLAQSLVPLGLPRRHAAPGTRDRGATQEVLDRAQRVTLLPFLQLGQTKHQRQNKHGVPVNLLSRVAPEMYTLDAALLARERQQKTQLTQFYDYGTNPKLYLHWQEYLCASGVPALALDASDLIFVKAGAEVFKRDVKGLVADYVDSGHFARGALRADRQVLVDEGIQAVRKRMM
ncbi:hypothetical protein V8E53_004887 [Lactarius tabidus]